MIRAVHPIKKSPCCKSQQPKPSIFRERSHSTDAEESSLQDEPSPLMQCSLMDIPEQAPLQPKFVTGEQQTTDIVEKSASPVIQRYVKVGLYEGSFGLDHVGVGVNSEKTLGFSPKEGLRREAEKGSWVEGEVKEDHGLLDSLTIRTNPRQEARLQAALNRAESSPQMFNLRQHNCSQHGAEILKSAGLNARSSPLPRVFFEGLKKQYSSGQKEASADGQPVQGKLASNAPAAETGTRPNRTGMPDRLKSGIESLSGMDMSDVRVHPNSELPARMDALAYTQGNQIYLGPGEERHLPHEAWHVVQQKQGRVRATFLLKESRVGVNDDPLLEREADEMGIKSQVAKSPRINIHPPNNYLQIIQKSDKNWTKESASAPQAAEIEQHFTDEEIMAAIDKAKAYTEHNNELKNILGDLFDSVVIKREYQFSEIDGYYRNSIVKYLENKGFLRTEVQLELTEGEKNYQMHIKNAKKMKGVDTGHLNNKTLFDKLAEHIHQYSEWKTLGYRYSVLFNKGVLQIVEHSMTQNRSLDEGVDTMNVGSELLTKIGAELTAIRELVNETFRKKDLDAQALYPLYIALGNLRNDSCNQENAKELAKILNRIKPKR